LTPVLGPRNAEVRRLRALLRDRRARVTEGAFVLEGPRVVEGALDRGVTLEALYLGTGAATAFAPLVTRARDKGTRIAELKEGVLEKVGTTRTPQPVLAVASSVVRPLGLVDGDGTVLVAVGVADPGNLGTILRSAEAAGADAVVTCGNSVDAQNPKAVRSSAGAIFGVTVVEGDDPVEVLDSLAAAGRRCVGTRPAGGEPYDATDLATQCSIVVGNEAHGLAPEVHQRLDGYVSVPMTTAAESLNVAMAATVLLFEAARQRRMRARSGQGGT
jgi:TrmH family RNA methyltransferase